MYGCIERSKAYIVRSIAVIIHSTKEGSSSIFTNVLGQKVTASWMLIKEVGHIMDKTSDTDQGTRLGLCLVYTRVSKTSTSTRQSLTALPVYDRKVAIVRWPRELLLGLAQTL